MKVLARLAAAAGAGVVAAAVFAVPAHAAPAAASVPVFVQNDALSGNAVVAYDRTPAGGLTRVGSYATGGRGGQLSGSVVDHLAAQGSLTYDPTAHLLYAVNADSNTVTTFAVSGTTMRRHSRAVPRCGGRLTWWTP